MSTQISQEVIPPKVIPPQATSTSAGASPVRVKGTKWNSFDFTDGKVGVLTGVWEFDFGNGIRDPAWWDGTWEPIRDYDDRIRACFTNYDGFSSIYDIVFLNDDWFVALEDNKLLRLGQRIKDAMPKSIDIRKM